MSPVIGVIICYRVAAGDPAPLFLNGTRAGDLLPGVVIRSLTAQRANIRVWPNGAAPGVHLESKLMGFEPGQWTPAQD